MLDSESNDYVTSLPIFYNSGINGLSFNFIYANNRSLRKNVNLFLAELNSIKNNVHCIVLSEIWIKEDEINLFKIDGFNIFARCNDTYRAGGVVCYVSEEANVSQVIVEMATADALILHVKIKHIYFNIFSIYRLQSFSEVIFINELSDALDKLRNNTIFVGDANINLLNSSQNNVQNYISLLNNHGFVSIINSPTRITQTSRTLVDHIFIRHASMNLFKCAIFDVGLTDHCLLGLKMNYSKTCVASNESSSLPSTHKQIVDYDLIKNKLQEETWQECFLSNDVNFCYNLFYKTLSSIVNSSQLIIKNDKLHKAKSVSPWINPNLLNRLARRKKLYIIHKKDRMIYILITISIVLVDS